MYSKIGEYRKAAAQAREQAKVASSGEIREHFEKLAVHWTALVEELTGSTLGRVESPSNFIPENDQTPVSAEPRD